MNVQFSNTNITFGEKYPTAKILQITSQTIFEPDGMLGFISTIKSLHKQMPRYVGSKGYKKCAETIGNDILAKYPELILATQEIKELAQKHPMMKKFLFKAKIQPILDRFESEIDIVI